jgi:hypothetical protein
MALVDYYFADPRVVLVPIEHLSPAGVSGEFGAVVAARRGWTPARLALLSTAVARYWSRTAELARRTRTWAPPRLRHIAVLREPLAIHPYAQLLNVSAWTFHDCDLDPDRSHAELVAYLLAHGERMARTGEVTTAALYTAAWWLARNDAECAAFQAAAAASTRPDAAALQALAEALPWIRQLRHHTLRPTSAGGHRAIPGSELLVPAEHEAAPQQLVDRWTVVARQAVDTYMSVWRTTDPTAAAALLDWLGAAAPPVLITAGDDRLLWDPARPHVLAPLRAELAAAAGAAVRDVQADLVVLDRRTRRFRASLADAAALPSAMPAIDQHGYTYLHRDRRLLVYNLDEPGIDRRHGPALPYARFMLGARAVHEWAHLAVHAGWVPLAVSAAELAQRTAALAARLDAAIANAPAPVRQCTAADLAALAAAEAAPVGVALTRLLLRRIPDFQSNLLAQRYLDEAERETYVRQNVRTLRDAYPPARLWRLLVRYLYEFQYLRFSGVTDRRAFFLRSTWCDADFIDSGVLDDETFDALTAAVATICDCYAVDESKFVA